MPDGLFIAARICTVVSLNCTVAACVILEFSSDVDLRGCRPVIHIYAVKMDEVYEASKLLGTVVDACHALRVDRVLPQEIRSIVSSVSFSRPVLARPRRRS